MSPVRRLTAPSVVFRVRSLAALVLCALTIACGKNNTSPTSPSPSTAQTRTISVSGDLAFGSVDINTSASRAFTIANSGNSPLTFTSVQGVGGTGTAGWTVTPTSGTIAAGGSLTATLRFSPTVAQFYGTVLTVVGDQTSGNAAININGTGVNNTPLFVMSGTGDTVFTMPTSVARVKITADYTRNSSNFIVKVGGRLVVNELIGTGWGTTHFEGTYAVTGGQTEITNSSGVAWSFTEVR
ncbi:MAG: choice-of-anchor D domain-containing protein [Acidobacteriota bacterium]